MYALLKTFRQKAPKGVLVVVEAVPYASGAEEQSFSAAYTFLHSHLMARRLLSEDEWKANLVRAGYDIVETSRLGITGGAYSQQELPNVQLSGLNRLPLSVIFHKVTEG